jgi:phage gp16-like protein
MLNPRKEDVARRRVEIARIHLQAKQLGIDEEVRRQMMFRLTGKRSTAEMDAADRAKVLDHLRRQFGKPKYPGRPHNIDSHEAPQELRKIEALLAEAKRPWSYADAMAKRIAGVERCAFLDGPGARKVLAALIYDRNRRGAREMAAAAGAGAPAAEGGRS